MPSTVPPCNILSNYALRYESAVCRLCYSIPYRFIEYHILVIGAAATEASPFVYTTYYTTHYSKTTLYCLIGYFYIVHKVYSFRGKVLCVCVVSWD